MNRRRPSIDLAIVAVNLAEAALAGLAVDLLFRLLIRHLGA